MISIIVPFWDSELWLGRCCQSLHENEGDFEYILVDDFSKDSGKSIAESYVKADDRFILLQNEHKKGVSGARNTGLDHMRGEWFTFLDADDTLCENAYETLIKATGISADLYQFNHLRHYEKVDRTVMKYQAGEGWYDIEHLPSCWCMVWNKLYRWETFKKVRFVEGLQYGEDEIYNLECFDIEDHHYNNKNPVIVHRFSNKESLSKTKRKDADGLIAQARALEEALYRLKKPQTRRAVCEVLSEHWTSNTYLNTFVKEDTD